MKPIRYSERFEIEGREFFAAPLSCETLEDEAAKIDALANGRVAGIDGLRIAVDIIHASVVRNHPEVTRDELRKILDTRNVGDAVTPVMKASGLEQPEAKPGEAGSP